ncbi:DUF6541 family protein [Brachybacterium sp. AOP25-B2-12]|uniref:DUF6541 family protein n=1 Tax=Brachybacterium sp. AOP25-B2-12 TaxID=3457710 RepID=UPI0040345CF4
MHWTELLPLIGLAALVLLVPGAVLGLALGVRGVDVLLRAPVFSVGVVGVGAVVCGIVGIRWSLLSLAVVTAVFAGLAALVSLVLRRWSDPAERPGRTPAAVWWGIGGAAVGGLLLCRQLKAGIISPDGISQSYDNIFHLNAIRYIIRTGDGSSLTLNSMTTADGSGSFYPAAWHDVTALVFSVFPGSVPAATNAMTFAVAALVWPLSMTALALALRPTARLHALAVGGLTAAFVGFPGIPMKWGILYPNMLGLAILPAFLMLVRAAVRDLERSASPARWWSTGGQVLVGAAAVSLAHPNALVAAAVLLLPWLLWVTGRTLRSARRDGSLVQVRTVLMVLGCVAVAGLFVVLRPPAENSVWGPSLPNGQAVGEFLTGAFNATRTQWVVAALVVAGVVASIRARRDRWVVAAWAVAGALYVVAASADVGPLRTFLTGPWYNDRFRLMPLAVAPAVLLAAAGVSAVAAWLVRALSAFDLPRLLRVASPAIAAVVVLVVAVWASMSRAMDEAWDSVAYEFKETPDSLLITSDEQAVLDAVDRYVPPGDVIVVDPWEGSALAYALEDREVTSRHSLSETPERYEDIVQHLDEPSRAAEVCAQVQATGAHWYLDFEDTLDIGRDYAHQYEGLEDVVESGAVTPVFTSGPVGLYRISECDR